MTRADLICTEQPQFKTNCELLWVKLEVTGVQPLFICAFYNPKEGNLEDLLELRRSIEEVNKKAKAISGFLEISICQNSLGQVAFQP